MIELASVGSLCLNHTIIERQGVWRLSEQRSEFIDANSRLRASDLQAVLASEPIAPAMTIRVAISARE